MLQPTCPLRSTKDIDLSLRKLMNSNSDSITSIKDVEGNHPNRMKVIKKRKLINFIEQGFEDMRPRQKLKKVYIRNGAIYISTRETILNKKTLVGKRNLPYIMPANRSTNIDTFKDLLEAKYFLSKR